MTMNPYQPPALDQHMPSALAGGDFDIGTAITEAYRVTSKNIGLWLGVGVVSVLAIVFATLTIIGYFLVVPVLFWGGVRFLLNFYDGRGDFNDLFSGFSNYGKVLGRMLLFTVIMVALVVLGEGPLLIGQFMKNTPLTVIGYVIYMAFLVFVLFRLYFAVFIMVDRDAPVLEALSASWEMTRGKTLKLTGLYFVAVFVAMAGLLAFCVGIVFTGMMAYVMYVSAYRQLAGSGQAPAQFPAPQPNWQY
jgi:membrane-anchored glycerophosphoryl diester phosphodiesterase (GDPDase)